MTGATRAAYALAVLTLANLAIGVALAIPAANAGMLGVGAGHALPLLGTLMAVKLLAACALAFCVRYMPLATDRPGTILVGLTAGVASVLTLLMAGMVGIYALLSGQGGLASLIGGLSLASLGLCGLWALSLLAARALAFGAATRIAGLVFAGCAILAALAPVIGLLAEFVGTLWWILLGRAYAAR